MLEQVLNYIHNYFEKERVSGTYSISSGTLEVDFLQSGQYFRIVGSVFNDGVHRYPAYDLVDETFTGEVWAMAVPPSVIAISNEIADWMEQYGNVVNGPYNSESFGGYSYTKGNTSGSGNSDTTGWRGVFGSRLNCWRKIS